MPEINKEFYDMKDAIGTKNYDMMNIITGTLFNDAVKFMKKIGILEEFLVDKNEVSRCYIESILNMEDLNDGN